MRIRLLGMGILMGSLLVAGCMRPFFARQKPRPVVTDAVSVRFFMPPEVARFTDREGDFDEQLAADSKYHGLARDVVKAADKPSDTSAMHVALWGGPFHGHDATYTLTHLIPGEYTFAMLNQDKPTAFQGWLHVNVVGDDLGDVLRRWRAELPKRKQWLAYDFELQGKLKTTDEEVFESFARQLRAFERLERQLDAAIQHEMKAQANTQQRNGSFLQFAEVLLFPGDHSFFRPTTQPAFTKAELAQLEEGDAASKMVLLADYPTAQWKLGLVSQVSDELARCKAVFAEEADRLARRKRFYTLTDHLYHHDRKFVENEMRLQQTLAAIDRVNEQMNMLRDRRLALAFITGLFAPDESMQALNEQQQDLMRERAVLEAQRQRFDLLCEQTDEDSARRVVFERNRQNVNRAMDNVTVQLAKVAEARTSLQTLRDQTDVIYRQGDQSLVAASLLDQTVPFPIRQTIEREALMTVRIEGTDQIHIPSTLMSLQAIEAAEEQPYQAGRPPFSQQSAEPMPMLSRHQRMAIARHAQAGPQSRASSTFDRQPAEQVSPGQRQRATSVQHAAQQQEPSRTTAKFARRAAEPAPEPSPQPRVQVSRTVQPEQPVRPAPKFSQGAPEPKPAPQPSVPVKRTAREPQPAPAAPKFAQRAPVPTPQPQESTTRAAKEQPSRQTSKFAQRARQMQEPLPAPSPQQPQEPPVYLTGKRSEPPASPAAVAAKERKPVPPSPLFIRHARHCTPQATEVWVKTADGQAEAVRPDSSMPYGQPAPSKGIEREPSSSRTQRPVHLSGMQEEPAGRRGKPSHAAQPADAQQDGCPWLLKILVPPCWFVENDGN